MNITLVETKGPDDFEIPELKKRVQESRKSRLTKHYKALSQSREVAFVSLDYWSYLSLLAARPVSDFAFKSLWSEPFQMFLYEIFVPQFARRQGIATAVLSEVERISTCEGLSAVRLRPSSLDSGITTEVLTAWYMRRGYVHDSDSLGVLVKTIGGKYWYAHDKFSKAIYILATGSEDVCSRLLHAWQHSLQRLDDAQLPENLQKDFEWIKKQLHKFNERYPGELSEFK
ncbi:MAG TPA: hypothetical protein VJL62_02325, partial [Thermodesulfobacteriota bacterium]|nr:hypothetical protein [Thermodesulfobacteriota bacterium]